MWKVGKFTIVRTGEPSTKEEIEIIKNIDNSRHILHCRKPIVYKDKKVDEDTAKLHQEFEFETFMLNIQGLIMPSTLAGKIFYPYSSTHKLSVAYEDFLEKVKKAYNSEDSVFNVDFTAKMQDIIFGILEETNEYSEDILIAVAPYLF